MRSEIFRYSSAKPVRMQGYWQRPFTFLADLFTGVEERQESDYFSGHFMQEMLDLKKFPMYIIFPEVWTNQETQYSGTVRTRIEISDTILDKFNSDTIGVYLRTKIATHIYGAPVFNMQFLVYKSGGSRMTISRKGNAHPVE